MKKPIGRTQQRLKAVRQTQTIEIGEVGIFWFFKGEIVRDAIPFTLGENYGDFVNGKSDHCNFWPNVQRRMPETANYEYDQVPRGRVVYRKKDQIFLVYGSEQFVRNDQQKEAVLSEFKLPPEKTVFKSDEHYAPVPGMLHSSEDVYHT